MSKISKIMQIMILLLVATVFIYGVDAASANIEVKSTNVTTGTPVTVTGKVNAGAWNLTLSGNGSSKGLVGQTDTTDNKSASTSITFTPTSPGSYKFNLTGDMTDYYTDVTENVGKEITIVVTDPPPDATEPTTPTQPTEPTTPTISSNANLKNLGINPNDFTGFRKSITSYEVTVPNEVSSIKIYAIAEDDKKATVSGTGQKTLQEGSNLFKIVVTAEAGNTKTYKLNVIRQVASAEITPNTSEDVGDSTGEQNTIGLSKIEVKGMTLSPEFAVDTYRYIVELEDEEITTLEQIKELIIAEVNFEGGTFEITGEEKLEKEENEVVISVKDVDGREIAIYTLVFKIKNIEDTADTVSTVNETTGIVENEENTFDKNKIIIIVSIIIISLIAIKSSITSYKQRKILQENGLIKTKKEYEDEIVEEEINETEVNNEIIEEQETTETESNEENRNDYIKDIFENNQMEFKPDDRDFVKKKKGRGKHS